ncbi:Os07g0149701 [Oryza sativa Japonica Group]|uniref:Os07g0149701 protein n=1 Tax=Oryza sativa subsp. japonica TaxID=39947 RepID=A0A0N7KMY0_ORYSJ|nr:Os07g0149701 [Oryza sativa Japonica Group]
MKKSTSSMAVSPNGWKTPFREPPRSPLPVQRKEVRRAQIWSGKMRKEVLVDFAKPLSLLSLTCSHQQIQSSQRPPPLELELSMPTTTGSTS